jgi:ABC-type glutathione transport system ATPase component
MNAGTEQPAVRRDDVAADVATLRLDSVTVAYLTTSGPAIAVNSASLVVRAGTAVGIVGESGCGKTTLGLALLRLLPDSAQVRRPASNWSVAISMP